MTYESIQLLHLQSFKESMDAAAYGKTALPQALHPDNVLPHRTRQDADKGKPWREGRQMPTDARSPLEEDCLPWCLPWEDTDRVNTAA